MWWLGFWQTARHAHWWLSADVRLPDRADPLAVGSIELDRLTEPLAALAAALPGLVATERAALVDVDRRIADTLPQGDDPASTASAIATRIELLGDRAAVLGAAARRAWTGAMVDPAGNLALFRELGGILLPQELRDRLRTAHAADTTLVVAPGPGLSGVPWELLVVDDDHDVRLVERATVLGGVSPAMLVNLARPASRAGGGRAVRVVDPTAAGSRTGGGRIYPDGVPEAWRSRTGDGDALLGAGAAGGCSPAELSAALQSQEWSRLVFVGHASATDPAMPTSAGLELAVDGETGDSRLTAGQWLRDPTRWPAPRRVGFVACQSDDAGYTEQIGLTLAALNAGARTVVATRWSLPSDGSERLVAGGAPIGSATTALALAVDAALGTTDPVGAIGEWQRDRLACWRSARSDAARRLHAPLVWSALVTYDIPDAAVSAIPGADDQPVTRRPAPGPPRHDAPRVPPAGDAAEVAKASLAAGVAAFGRADWQEAREHYLVALAAFTACGDLKGVADATTNVGNTAYFLGDLEEAADRYRTALPLYRDLDLDRQVAVVGQNLGNVSFQRGELDVAAEQYRAAAEALLRGDFRRHAADTLVNLGAVLIELGRPHVALGHLDQAGALYRETCDESELGGKLAELDQNTGLALAGAKSFERARAHLLSALRHWQSDEPSAERAARANHNLGLVAFRAGDLPEAQLRYTRALEHFHTVGNEHEAADARLGLGTVARHRGDVRAARSNFRQAQEHYRRTGQWLAYAQAAFNEGLTHPDDSDRRFDLLAGAWAAMQSMSWRLAHVSERAAWRAALDHANDEVLETARLGGRDRQFAELVESLRIAGTLRRVAPTPLSPTSVPPSSLSPTSLTPASQEEADRDSPFVEPLPSMTLSAGPVVPWAASSAADEAPCDAPPWIDCGWPPTLADAVARAEEIVAVAGATALPLRRGAVSLIPLLSRHPEEEGPGWTDRAPGSTGTDAD